MGSTLYPSLVKRQLVKGPDIERNALRRNSSHFFGDRMSLMTHK